MITPKLSDYILSTEYNKLPESVTLKVKDCFTDFLGVALRGAETESGAAVKRIIKEGDESTILGSGKSSALEAGLANGIFAHSLDLDDGHRQAHLHPGACVLPAALSLSEAFNKSGKELIEAIVVGYQVAVVVGLMVNPEHRMKGFHSTGTCGTLGAAAAACKVMDLSKTEINQALGLAGTQAAGLLESDHSGSMGKHLHAGKAAQSGILSALLVKNGFTGSEGIFESDDGFLKSMAGIDPNKVYIDNLIKNYKILEVYFKIYPVCRHLHSSIEALLHVVNEENIQPEDIQNIQVETYKIAAEHNNYKPTSKEALRQSLPMSLAVALLNDYHGLNNLVEFNYPPNNPDLTKEITDLSQKITIKTNNTLDHEYPKQRPSKVTVYTDEDVYKKMVRLPYGEPENPLKKSDIQWKFENLNPKVNIEVLQIIENMEVYDDINQFMDNLNSNLI